ncbi:MAG: PD-(D/E)XK nuclease family protein [Streptomyces sp.]|jgi:hypothetical protein|nr:PD-(D/E)XK nuclease family protein [Streptomyces sp.]
MTTYTAPSSTDHLSYTQLAMLDEHNELSCPRKYGYRYRLGLVEPASLSMIAGRAFDSGVNALFTARMGSESEAQALRVGWAAATKAFDEARTEVRDDDLQAIDAYAVLIENAIAAFSLARRNVVPVAVQCRHDLVIPDPRGGDPINVIGYSDRIDRDGTIVDHKFTGAARWNAEGKWDDEWVARVRDQLVIYWLARRQTKRRGEEVPGRVVARARLEVICASRRRKEPLLRSLDLRLTREDERRVIEALRQAAAAVHEGMLPARPGRACQFCGFRDRCRQDEASRGARFADLVGLGGRAA